MKYSHRRRSIRLKNYDYSQSGLYFITICTHNKVKLFGEIKNSNMLLNEYGKIVKRYWNEITKYYPDIKLLEYIIMPNHIHGILWFTKYITDNQIVGATKPPVRYSTDHELPLYNESNSQNELFRQDRRNRRKMVLPKIIGRFKMQSAKQINMLRGTSGLPVWQRNYYEHIIRNADSYLKIAEYIVNNPRTWEKDKYF